MADPCDELNRALRSLYVVECRFLLATNSLRFQFDFARSERGRAYIWIDPPWRLTLAGKLITGSASYPRGDGENQEPDQGPWNAWVALFAALETTTLTNASVGGGIADLRLAFASGHRIETFGNSHGDGCWWYYRDRVTGEVFEGRAGGVYQVFGEPAE
jgi:hypothetical protein